MKKTFIIVAAAVLTLVGCTKEIKQDSMTSTPASTVEMSVIPMNAVKNMPTRGYAESDKFYETSYENLHSTTDAEHSNVARMMQISSYLYPQNGLEGNYFVGNTFKSNGESPERWWNVVKDGAEYKHVPIFWPVGGVLDLLAFSLTEDTGKGAGRNVTVAWDETNAASKVTLTVPGENTQNDILYASASRCEATEEGEAVGMTFKHAQAWLEFALTGNLDSESKPIVHLKNIVLENVYNAGTLTITNNGGNALASWSFDEGTEGDTPVDNFNDVKDLTSVPQYLDMLIPQQPKTAFVLYYTLGKSKQVLSYRFTTDQKTWLAGEKYIYNINITSNEITVYPRVSEWVAPDKPAETTSIVQVKYNSVVGKVNVDGLGTATQSAAGIDEYTIDTWGANATLKAEVLDAKKGDWMFEKWSDGNTENPRDIIVTENVTYEAIFTDQAPAITVTQNNLDCGKASIEGETVTKVKYAKGTEVKITATKNGFYKFIRWDDGNTDNPRTIIVGDSDKTYKAIFGFDASVTYNDTRATVMWSTGTQTATVATSGEKFTAEGKNVTLVSTPKSGYMFWKYVEGPSATEYTTYNKTLAPYTDVSSWSTVIIPSGAIKGEFSIASGKKVVFSEGNLQATLNSSGEPTAWSFAASQEYVLGNDGANVSHRSGKIDLFGWSASTDADDAKWGICVSDNYGDSENYKKYGGDQPTNASFNDWGKAKTINSVQVWKTLSSSDWNYLLISRKFNVPGWGSNVQGEGAGFDRAKYNGVYGILIYPDGYDKTRPVVSPWAVISSIPSGCVFIPAAGVRTTDVWDAKLYGHYWTPEINTYTGEYRAFRLDFGSGSDYIDMWASDLRDRCCSVRLVSEL